MLVLALILCGLGVTLWVVLDDGDGADDAVDSELDSMEADEEAETPPPKERRPRTNRPTRATGPKPAEANSPPEDPAGTPAPPPPVPASTPAVAPPDTPTEGTRLVKRPVAELDQEYEWPEGENTKKAYVDPRVLVEFAPKSDEARQPIPPVLGAQLLSDGSPRVWLLEEIGDTSEGVGAQATAEAQLSPLLHESSSTTSAGRAPTGRLFVKLDAEWTKEEVEDFASRHDLSDLKAGGKGPGWWSVYAGPGLAALEKATAVRALDDVSDCQVDWWRAPARK
jgi:hypothetical protein